MHCPRRILTAALFALLAFPLAASAQSAAPVKLSAGTWTGAIITPGNQDITNLTYEVGYKADTLAITMIVGGSDKFALNEIEVSDTKIKFSFTDDHEARGPGPKVICVLNLKEAGYSGQCSDDEGSIAPLTMVPPAKEAKS